MADGDSLALDSVPAGGSRVKQHVNKVIIQQVDLIDIQDASVGLGQQTGLKSLDTCRGNGMPSQICVRTGNSCHQQPPITLLIGLSTSVSALLLSPSVSALSKSMVPHTLSSVAPRGKSTSGVRIVVTGPGSPVSARCFLTYECGDSCLNYSVVGCQSEGVMDIPILKGKIDSRVRVGPYLFHEGQLQTLKTSSPLVP